MGSGTSEKVDFAGVAEFADEECFFRGGGEEMLDGLLVAAGHGEDVGGLVDEFPVRMELRMTGDIDALIVEDVDGVGAGGLAIDGADAGGGDGDVERGFATIIAKQTLPPWGCGRCFRCRRIGRASKRVSPWLNVASTHTGEGAEGKSNEGTGEGAI